MDRLFQKNTRKITYQANKSHFNNYNCPTGNCALY